MVKSSKMRPVKDWDKIVHLSTTKQTSRKQLMYSWGDLTWQQIPSARAGFAATTKLHGSQQFGGGYLKGFHGTASRWEFGHPGGLG